MWHQQAWQSSFLLQNYQVPTAQRTQFGSITKTKTSHDIYGTIRSYWDNISTHINILGGNIRIHFMFQRGCKTGPSCLCPMQAYGGSRGIALAQNGGEASTTLLSCFYGGKEQRDPLNRRMGRAQRVYERFG
jgi:hypothetical protein